MEQFREFIPYEVTPTLDLVEALIILLEDEGGYQSVGALEHFQQISSVN